VKAAWRVTRLGDVTAVTAGQSPEGSSYNDSGDGLPFYQGKKEFREKFIGPPTTWTTKTTKIALDGDILMSVRAPVGPINLATEQCCIGRGLAAIRALNGLNRDFLYYYLLSKQEEICGAAGAIFPSISKTEIEKIPLAYPSAAEQQRIVVVLDKAFAAIATARANTDKNLQNARALLQSYLDNLFAASNGHVKMRPLVSLCSYFADSAHRTPKYQTEGIPALRPRDVVNGELNLSEAARVSETEYEVQTKRRRPAPGDIVYSRELSYGWATMLPESPRVCLSQGMCIFRPSHEVDAKYLLYMLNGPIGRQQAEHAAVGTAHPHINLSDIKSYLIPFVPMPEQREISKTLSEIKSALCQIEHNCQKKIAALDTLKQSLLHQAFAGEL